MKLYSAVLLPGADGTHQVGDDGTLTITCSGTLADLTGIYVDGILVDPYNYSLQSGSKILTLNSDYLNGLSVGTHMLTFEYGTESIETSFIITAANSEMSNSESDVENTTGTAALTDNDVLPKTVDQTPIAEFILLSLISGVCVICFGRKRNMLTKNLDEE